MLKRAWTKLTKRADPEMTRVVFKMGDAFPADDDLACFLVSLSMGLNDLLFVSRLLVPEDEPLLSREATPGENAYLLASSVSHIWELLQLLRIGDSTPAIRSFLDGLRSDAQGRLQQLRELYSGGGPADLKNALAFTRNKTWHYPPPTDRALRSALREVAEYRGVLEWGERMPSLRAIFADEVIVQFLTRYGRDEHTLGRLLSEIADVTISYVYLAQYAIDAHLAGLPDGKLRTYGPGESIPAGEVPSLNDANASDTA